MAARAVWPCASDATLFCGNHRAWTGSGSWRNAAGVACRDRGGVCERHPGVHFERRRCFDRRGADQRAGEDVTEMLELIPRQWKVIQHVREKFSCRSCEAITQPPAPSHPIARGRAGPGLLAHVLFSKYGLHLPLNRQSDTYAREGVNLDVSTLADWVGACAATLMPLILLIRAYVFAAERIHADDTTVRVLAKGKTRIGRLWTYVRDDRPFGGPDCRFRRIPARYSELMPAGIPI